MRNAREDFALALKEALCSEQEIKAWQMGEPFSDPWPDLLRKV